MKYAKKEKTLHYGQFPIGTVCEVHVCGLSTRKPEIVTVKALHKTGPDNYIIETTTPGKVTEFESYNTSHVTRIIKRGPGIAVLDKSQERGFIKMQKSGNDFGDRIKHHSVYQTTSLRELVSRLVTEEFSNDTTMVDIDVMLGLIEKRHIVKKIDAMYFDWKIVYDQVSKKKLRSVIKQVFNKCLVNHKKSQRESDDLDREIYERDMEADLDFDIRYCY